ncbi:uncharacterized protein KGF55_002261 [Candida pseudojiufengensis]|uniref:uncharacterized protein n=1 Tax=Candida pseudojiufengensis TaxID=497109 RepID=UPI0022242305|nr:uncharacterized protein KGF55_002261 [Candida pseudojiufengensis]KAI5964319.1 hypothetical protein KGF55_002261 [Candida pseudojiufengensis]
MPSRESSPTIINGKHLHNHHTQHFHNNASSSSPSPSPAPSRIDESTFYISPTTKTKKLNGYKNLTIEVPNNNNTNNNTNNTTNNENDEPIQHPSMRSLNTILGEPLNFDNQSPISNTFKSISPINFPNITQLPTPVLKNGSFSNYSHHNNNQILSSPPRDKSNNIDLIRVKSIQSPRILSDYKPISRVNSLNSNSMNNKRIMSNPPPELPYSSSTVSSIGSNKQQQFDQPILPQNQNNNQNQQQSNGIESPITPSTSPLLPHNSKFQKFPDPQQEEQEQSLLPKQQQEFYSERFGITFKYIKNLGEGNFSNVILARTENNNNNNNEEIAIKIITIPNSKSQIINFKSFILRELNILYHVSYHPCITSLIDFKVTLDIKMKDIESEFIPEEETTENAENIEIPENRDQLIFMNYCRGGTLLNFLLNHNQTMNLNNLNYWILLRRIISELILTTFFLHKQNIIHRDIKLENVLLLYNIEEIEEIFKFNEILTFPLINLSDFGLSKKLNSPDQLLSTRCGSKDYIAPEVIIGLNYDGKLSDTWSIGVLTYCLLEGRLPFDITPQNYSTSINNKGISPSVIKRRNSKKTTINHRIAMIDWVWNNIEHHLKNNELNPLIIEIFQDLKLLVEKILVRKDRRPNLETILGDPDFFWIKENVPKELLDYI